MYEMKKLFPKIIPRKSSIGNIIVMVLVAGTFSCLSGCALNGASAKAPDQGIPLAGDEYHEIDERTRLQDVPIFDPDKPAVIKRGNKDRKMVALTIDDGWSKDDRILNLLEEHAIRCTVFPIGGRGVAEENPDWIERMDADGFEICTHTYSHYKLTDRPEQWVIDDIRKGQDVIAEVTGKRYPYMRPPGGFYDEAVIRAAAENDCYLVLWTSEVGDTRNGITVDQEVNAVLSNLCNGNIILCHFGGINTFNALERLVPEIKACGYEFGTLTELLAP
ncbi:MAG: hypothetical protein A2Y75_11475 [Candidatus Solincola sediminis]|uniref:NodB homology domain-containing protein n=1 Tax=Candidatus Solincola sediminis TaxID=1797199 RepID=A0A1F2WRJ6_9ACTN|nr:MAG: hypothetical protein A2Y75_11475 [Candidatus Solincola sediminis]